MADQLAEGLLARWADAGVDADEPKAGTCFQPTAVPCLGSVVMPTPVMRLLVLWHLLSMDAPTVALCWTIFVAAVSGTRLPWTTEAAMWVAVWTLYAADRLMDTRRLASDGEAQGLESRHLFHDHHRRPFVAAIIASLGCLGVLLPRLPSASLRLYGIEGVFMAGYFVLIHSGVRKRGGSKPEELGRRRLPKELLVGPFFAAAVFIPTVARRPELRLELLPLAVLFAGLCSLNCLFIFDWEHAKPYQAAFGTAWALERLERLVWVFVGISLGMCLPLGAALRNADCWPVSFRLYAFACASSGAALFGFDRLGARLSRTALRVAADICLLTPLLVFPLLGSH